MTSRDALTCARSAPCRPIGPVITARTSRSSLRPCPTTARAEHASSFFELRFTRWLVVDEGVPEMQPGPARLGAPRIPPRDGLAHHPL